ncbi:hypothetical protein SAMN05421796_105132 [Chryseobacterium piscicola]|uniref:DUF2808 domain-containing protein n=1 Tax=Chryseobacterium piscicola TaxID=551459 RepID=A0A1N7MQB6_9FLAO|nr:hypothetical protein [Chryseobacterium piscicola]PQA93399.1 hypothetical protein B0A70_09585 [Chryseobacterium piscicola]SIS88314.1 hypothetical protein SAMN05421796_105132 [Chryseobacterium piscicola]
MKKFVKILSTIILFSFSIFHAQQIKVLEPYYLKDGKSEQFEKATAKIEAKAIGMGYGGVNNYLTIFNSKHSTVRFKNNEIPKFYIKLPDNAFSESITIVKADKVKESKTYRRFVQSGVSAGGTKDMSKYQIVLPLKTTENSVYEIIIPQNLEAGEYSFVINSGVQYDPFTNPMEKKLFCFAIEP